MAVAQGGAKVPAPTKTFTVRRVVVSLLFAGAILVGAVVGVFLAFESDLPQIASLEDFKPNIITQVFAADGSILGEFAIERRVVVGFKDIPPLLRNAIVAVEDADFWKHLGVNPWRVPGAALANLRSGRRDQGASTLTMQLSRLLFLTPEKTPERKIKEVILAFQIEKNFTKEEIFTLYCNQIYFGHGHYGVEAASRFFFGKPMKDLTLAEAALLAGVPQNAPRLSPVDHPDRALARRNHVLDRMVEEKYISASEADAAKATPLDASPQERAAHHRPSLPRGGEEVPRARIRQPADLPGRPSRLHHPRSGDAADRNHGAAQGAAGPGPAGARLREARGDRPQGRAPAGAPSPRRVGPPAGRGRRGARESWSPPTA